LAKNPELDWPTFKKISKFFQEDFKVGPKEEVKFKNPITGKEEKQKYSFRVINILQACRDQDSDEVTVDFV